MIWVWTVVFAAALIIELATPSALISVWFALGALVSLLLALAAAPLWGQLAAFGLIDCALRHPSARRPLAARQCGRDQCRPADRRHGRRRKTHQRPRMGQRAHRR